MKTKVLLVDDNQPIRESLAHALESETDSVVVAANGEAALLQSIDRVTDEPLQVRLHRIVDHRPILPSADR